MEGEFGGWIETFVTPLRDGLGLVWNMEGEFNDRVGVL